MKSYLFTISTMVLLFLASFSFAQDIPKKGAIIKIELTEVVVQANKQLEIPLFLVRSKVETKRKFDAPQVQPIDGLITSITLTEETDKYLLTLKPTEISPGRYNLIIKGAGNNKHLITGTMVSLVVEESTTFSSSN